MPDLPCPPPLAPGPLGPDHQGKHTVSVVVPVFYNERSLPSLLKELLVVSECLAGKGLTLELIFVDDGSGDDSLAELLKIRQTYDHIKVIKLTRNFGAVHASKTGLQFASGDCCLVLAADLQDPPELIPMMVDKWLAGSKYVVCARTDRDDPVTSKLFSAFYYTLVRAFVIPEYPRGGYDLALMDRAVVAHVRNSSKNINTALFAYWLGFKPDVILYQRKKRIHGRSRWTFAKKLKLFTDSILGFSVLPIRLISALGLIVSALSFSYGLIVVISALLHREPVAGFASLAALLTFLLGLIIIMLGVIGEYIWRIFDEINDRPEVVIDEIY